MSALLCHIATGAGALNLYAGIVQSPRYADTAITIELHDGVPADIVLDGPLDKHYSYVANGMRLDARLTMGGWIIDAVSTEQRDVIVIDAAGRLMWTRAVYAAPLDAWAVGMFTGTCEVKS